MTDLVGALPDGPLDIIGDVHGEIDALLAVLHRLGCDPERGRAERPVVFVGDLIDRGPDSPAVIEVVRALVEAGIGYSIAGNHELNLLMGDRKEGSGWFWDDPDDHWQARGDDGSENVPFGSRPIDPRDRERTLELFRQFPLVLERDDLRIVHAAWHPPSVDAVRGEHDLAETSRRHSRALLERWRESGLLERARGERAEFANLRQRNLEPDRPLPAHTAIEVESQSRHPVKVLTSGLEQAIAFEDRFFVGGRWRLVERVRWWRDYREHPAVIVGHYWRDRHQHTVGSTSFFHHLPFEWLGPNGNVFCIDYSVGRRYAERYYGANGDFRHGLGALRWPERTVVFDDRPEPIATSRFGG